MEQVYANIQWDKKKSKKKVSFADTKGGKWGSLKKEKANATAITTGNGLVVVDIDTKDLSQIDPKLRKLLPDVPTVETKRGYHYYFNVEDSSMFTTKTEVFKHVDIRAEGGLVFNDYWGEDSNISYEAKGSGMKMPKKLSKLIIENSHIIPKDKKKKKIKYNNTDKKKMKEILSYVKCYDDYTDWFKVGMALKAWDEVEGLKLWDKWSKQSDAYDKDACTSKWRTFSKGETDVGTLYHLAKDNGYVVEKKPMFTKKDKLSVADPDYVPPVKVAGKKSKEGKEGLVDWDILNKVKAEVMRVRGGYEMLNTNGKWIFALDSELWSVVNKVFGNPFNMEMVQGIDDEVAKVTKVEVNEDGGITRKDKDSTVKADALKSKKKEMEDKIKAIKQSVKGHIVTYNQYDEKSIEIDPFKEEDKVELIGDTIHITLCELFPNIDLEEPDFDTKKYLEDYRKHFAHFDEFLDFITASRFAPDRKKAYLYTKMISDFGKSFIGDVFFQLGLVANVNEKELKKAGTGDPVGLSAGLFRTAWIVFFDEVKYINGDFKGITNNMTLSPKGQKRVTVPVYTKWLANAEGLDALVNNTEQQFANRFSFWDMGNKSLDKRKLFIESKAKYFMALKWEVYCLLQEKISEYIDMGKLKAYDKAQKRISKFHAKYALAESMEANINEFLEIIIQRVRDVKNSGKFKHEGIDKVIYDSFVVEGDDIYAKRVGSFKHIFTALAKENYGDDYKSLVYKAHYLREIFGELKSKRLKEGVRKVRKLNLSLFKTNK